MGDYQFLTYVVEEIAIPANLDLTLVGGPPTAPTALRLSITGGPFVPRALAPTIWVDDVPLRYVHTGPDLTRLSTLVFDRALLHDGATLGVSYGRDREG